MKKLIVLGALALGMLRAEAQNTIEQFNVGPYIVDYYGPGSIKYRLNENIDLAELFEIDKDTVVIEKIVEPQLVKNAIVGSLKLGMGTYSMSYGVSIGYTMQVANGIYFTPGISLNMINRVSKPSDCSTVEVGVPLTIGYSQLNHKYTTLYGQIGIAPTYYTVNKKADTYTGKESGLLISPIAEFGFNVPMGSNIVRIGLWGEMKLNTAKWYDNVYKGNVGVGFAGLKVGLVL